MPDDLTKTQQKALLCGITGLKLCYFFNNPFINERNAVFILP
ncbi:MAG: hypothetical protein K0S33_2938 [Bacteroidetes bacterium]|jgi:hypothetical protein|nr:hypothetical protein [Bacteroidota bacterium]